MPNDVVDEPQVFLSLEDLHARGIRLSRLSLRRAARDGRFPQARQLSAKRVAWLRSEVEAWEASRPAAKKMKPERRRKTARRK